MLFKRIHGKVVRFVLVAGVIAVSATASARRRVIAYGWDVLHSPASKVLQHADKWDKTPVDGVVISISAKNPAGGSFTHRGITTDKGWTYEAFKPQVEILKKIVKHKSLRHSLLGAVLNHSKSKRFDWTDDEVWRNFGSNMGVLARIVRESGMDGVCIDNEDYGSSRQFYRKESDPPYDELRLIARKRGREVFAPMFREKPDMVLLAFWFLSFQSDYVRYAPEEYMEKARSEGYLWPAFIEGILEVMPETATLHDGNEYAYTYVTELGDYYQNAVRILSRFSMLLEPEYRVRYRTRARVSAGFYLDVYTNKSTAWWYLPPMEGGTRLDRFSANYLQAEASCDDYIWFYGEKHPWIEWEGGDRKWMRPPTWNEALPGFHDVFEARRDHAGFAARKFSGFGSDVSNLFMSADCRIGTAAGSGLVKDVFPEGCFGWKPENIPGSMGTDTSTGYGDSYSICLDRVSKGCETANVHGLVQGRNIVLRVRSKGGKPRVSVFYYYKKKWRFALGCVKMKFGEPASDGWRTGYASVPIVNGADGFGMQMAGDADAKVWYDDIAACEINP